MTATFEPTALLRRIHAEFPDPAANHAREISGQGQNNVVLVVDDRWLFRFPRYQNGVKRPRARSARLSSMNVRDNEERIRG